MHLLELFRLLLEIFSAFEPLTKDAFFGNGIIFILKAMCCLDWMEDIENCQFEHLFIACFLVIDVVLLLHRCADCGFIFKDPSLVQVSVWYLHMINCLWLQAF